MTTARVGDCFVDGGTQDDPQMQKVACGSGTLQVLRRFDRTTDMGRCAAVPGTTNTFYYQVSGDRGGSFVLCMAQR